MAQFFANIHNYFLTDRNDRISANTYPHPMLKSVSIDSSTLAHILNKNNTIIHASFIPLPRRIYRLHNIKRIVVSINYLLTIKNLRT